MIFNISGTCRSDACGMDTGYPSMMGATMVQSSGSPIVSNRDGSLILPPRAIQHVESPRSVAENMKYAAVNALSTAREELDSGPAIRTRQGAL